jgi:hypothetical protein
MAKAYQYRMRPCPFHPPVELVDEQTGPRDLAPIVALDPLTGLCHVTCPVCNCRGPIADSAEVAVDMWNQDYVPPAEGKESCAECEVRQS